MSRAQGREASPQGTQDGASPPARAELIYTVRTGPVRLQVEFHLGVSSGGFWKSDRL